MNSKLVKANDCRDFVRAVLVKLGNKPDSAQRWAELLVQTSLLGIDSHGIRMFDRYVRFAKGGGVVLDAKPKVVLDSGSCVTMDAQTGWGHLSADVASDTALARARQHGISCVAMRNCNHVGACGLYVLKASEKDFIGICSTVGRAALAPWGGKQPLIGPNPIAISAPVADKPSFLFDISSTVTAMGRITEAKDLKEEIPSGWALDRDGNPTTNPEEAIHGTLLPIGNHKGYGLALGMEILTIFLSGGSLAWDINSWILQTAKPMQASFMMITIDIERFQPLDAFKQRMRRWLEHLTSSAKRAGFEQIYYPGEREGQQFAYRSKHGIPVDERTVRMFSSLAREFGIGGLKIQKVTQPKSK